MCRLSAVCVHASVCCGYVHAWECVSMCLSCGSVHALDWVGRLLGRASSQPLLMWMCVLYGMGWFVRPWSKLSHSRIQSGSVPLALPREAHTQGVPLSLHEPHESCCPMYLPHPRPLAAGSSLHRPFSPSCPPTTAGSCILDGNLLWRYATLPRDLQQQLVQAVQARSPDQLMADLSCLARATTL